MDSVSDEALSFAGPLGGGGSGAAGRRSWSCTRTGTDTHQVGSAWKRSACPSAWSRPPAPARTPRSCSPTRRAPRRSSRSAATATREFLDKGREGMSSTFLVRLRRDPDGCEGRLARLLATDQRATRSCSWPPLWRDRGRGRGLAAAPAHVSQLVEQFRQWLFDLKNCCDLVPVPHRHDRRGLPRARDRALGGAAFVQPALQEQLKIRPIASERSRGSHGRSATCAPARRRSAGSRTRSCPT